MHITNHDGGDRVLARKPDLANEMTQIMVLRWQALGRPLLGGADARAQSVCWRCYAADE